MAYMAWRSMGGSILVDYLLHVCTYVVHSTSQSGEMGCVLLARWEWAPSPSSPPSPFLLLLLLLLHHHLLLPPPPPPLLLYHSKWVNEERKRNSTWFLCFAFFSSFLSFFYFSTVHSKYTRVYGLLPTATATNGSFFSLSVNVSTIVHTYRYYDFLVTW